MKKIISILMCLSILLSVVAISTSAASYPLIYPKDYTMYVAKGTTAKLQFTIFPEYNNEKYFINVYKGKGVNQENLVASASNSIYNSSIATRDLTITWDTSNAECGIYTVEYYMHFYTFHEWHETPNRSSLMTVRVFEPGEIANTVLNTDIKAFIDGHPIRSYNIDGYTSIVVEDLNQYGFEVVYDNNERTLKIKDVKGPVTSTYAHVVNTQPVGSKAMDVYYTDIRTYVKSVDSDYFGKVNAYNANGYTLIKIDELDEYGVINYDNNTRTITFNRK